MRVCPNYVKMVEETRLHRYADRIRAREKYCGMSYFWKKVEINLSPESFPLKPHLTLRINILCNVYAAVKQCLKKLKKEEIVERIVKKTPKIWESSYNDEVVVSKGGDNK